MKFRFKLTSLLLAAALMLGTSSAHAWWGWGGNDYWDDNDWPVFTPMYWMEEMFDEWDDDYWDDDYYRYGPGYGWGGPGYGWGGPGYGGYGPGYGWGGPRWGGGPGWGGPGGFGPGGFGFSPGGWGY